MPSRSSASRLEGALIARKGEAAPAPSTSSDPVTVVAPLTRVPTPLPPVPVAKGAVASTIAVTVRLDPDRYERLKIHGAKKRLTNQDILVEALDIYLGVKA